MVEFLSPEHKVGLGFINTKARRDLLFSPRQLNLVEIDLLVSGRCGILGTERPLGHSSVIVARADQRGFPVYPWSIRAPLPIIPLPLRKPDADIPLDLAAIYAEAYKRSRYAKSIDRKAPLNLPLAAEDIAWAEKIGREAMKAESA